MSTSDPTIDVDEPQPLLKAVSFEYYKSMFVMLQPVAQAHPETGVKVECPSPMRVRRDQVVSYNESLDGNTVVYLLHVGAILVRHTVQQVDDMMGASTFH